MATEADLIQKFKDLNIPVGADFEELIHAAFAGANLADLVNNYDSRITTVENNLATKADDSKVVHDNKDGTEQLNGVKVQPYNKLVDTIGGRNYLINTQNPSNPVKFAGVSSIDTSGTVTFSNDYIKVASNVSSTASEAYYRFTSPDTNVMPLPAGTYTLVVELTSSDNVFVRPRTEYSTDGKTFQDPPFPSWEPSSTEKQFRYTFTIPSNATGWYISLEMYADDGSFDNTGKSFQFRNASIQKGNIATDSLPAPEDKADDSKVVHNSGNEEIGGQKTFDMAPIDKTTGNPYITKDGVPTVDLSSYAKTSDVTTAISSATANMVDSSKATNFTAGLQSGGVNVATAADLKSLEDASWHEVDLPDTSILKQAHFMYRSEPIDTHYNTSFILAGKVIVPKSNSSTGVILLDLSSYLPISKADYKNYTVNSTLLGPDDKTFAGSDNSNFNPSYYINANSINVKLIDSNLVLYSSYGYAYFETATSAGAPISVSLSSDSTSLPTIDFVTSTKS